jgi:GT2 family glycosyltransferase
MLPNLIIPVLNRYDLLQRMFDSIDMKIAHLVVIDNGDNLDKITFPKLAKNVHYIPLPGNLGVAGSWNLGIKVLPHHDRWFFGSNDIILAPGDLMMLADAKPDELTLTESFPSWQLFAVGEEVIRNVGLFDENFYPAYFEDNDFLRRVRAKNIPVTQLPLQVQHDNSSTLKSSVQFQEHNSRTFQDNQNHFLKKKIREDFSPGHWSLTRRRRNEWLR